MFHLSVAMIMTVVDENNGIGYDENNHYHDHGHDQDTDLLVLYADSLLDIGHEPLH